MKITKKQAERLGKKFKINFDIISFDEWIIGLNIELEHGTKFKISNITNNGLDITAKIAIAHLIEDPRYYHYLSKLEAKREKYWLNHKKPDIFNL